MTFEEMQLLLQSIVVAQQETAATVRETAAAQRETAAAQRETAAIVRETEAILRETTAAVREITAGLQETKKVVDSNSRAIQAMLDQAATDRLKHEERMERMERLSEGLVNMLSSIDEDRPTILRKLNTIEQKTNSILDRLPPNN
jgi:methyl-accepting chemotaxis protein